MPFSHPKAEHNTFQLSTDIHVTMDIDGLSGPYLSALSLPVLAGVSAACQQLQGLCATDPNAEPCLGRILIIKPLYLEAYLAVL